MNIGSGRMEKDPPPPRKPLLDAGGDKAMNQVRSRREASHRVGDATAAFLIGDPHYALHGHGIDDHAKAVLGRLSELGRNSDSVTAAEAIVAALPQGGWETLFADCIVAEWRARSHRAWISNAKVALERHPEAQRAIKILERFLNPPRGAGFGHDPVSDALDELHGAVSSKKRLASDLLQLFSRKTTPEAARAVGVGWIRESLIKGSRRAGSGAKPRHLAAIATAALNMGEITEDAARKASMPTERLDALRGRSVQG
jgi:hypothetical protein